MTRLVIVFASVAAALGQAPSCSSPDATSCSSADGMLSTESFIQNHVTKDATLVDVMLQRGASTQQKSSVTSSDLAETSRQPVAQSQVTKPSLVTPLCTKPENFASIKNASAFFAASCEKDFHYGNAFCVSLAATTFELWAADMDAPWEPDSQLCDVVRDLLRASADHKMELGTRAAKPSLISRSTSGEELDTALESTLSRKEGCS